MTARDPETIIDPERIRALAHPLRLRLIDYLSSVETATATECSEHTGESVASCSFHLRMLAKYGYIEPAARRGREKPWKFIRRLRDMSLSPDEPDSLSAITSLSEVVVLTEVERVRRFFSHAHEESFDWLTATTLTAGDMWLTIEEMTLIGEQLKELATRHLERNADPTSRPPGARKVKLFVVLNANPIQQKDIRNA